MKPSRASAEQPKTLLGKIVVVTGGSSGNGRAIALECAWRGANVVIAARTPEPLAVVASEIEALGAEALAVTTDVTVREDVERLAARAVQQFGRIDVWVNNAGGAFLGTIEDSTDDLTNWLIDLNIKSVIYGVQTIIPIMKRQQSGQIINIASIAGRIGFAGMGVYSGTKAFVEVYTQALRQELMHAEKTGIKVSAVLPTAVRTPFFDKAPNTSEHSQGGYLVPPTLEPSQVGRAVADGIEHYRPVILPFKPAKSLGVLYEFFPVAVDRMMSVMRSDHPIGPFTSRKKGSHRDRKPIGPFVRNGRLER
jgi:short-subunit dehydrogenase